MKSEPLQERQEPLQERQARQPCLQKLLPLAKFSANTARTKGVTPLTPCAARLPGESLN